MWVKKGFAYYEKKAFLKQASADIPSKYPNDVGKRGEVAPCTNRRAVTK